MSKRLSFHDSMDSSSLGESRKLIHHCFPSRPKAFSIVTGQMRQDEEKSADSVESLLRWAEK